MASRRGASTQKRPGRFISERAFCIPDLEIILSPAQFPGNPSRNLPRRNLPGNDRCHRTVVPAVFLPAVCSPANVVGVGIDRGAVRSLRLSVGNLVPRLWHRIRAYVRYAGRGDVETLDAAGVRAKLAL